MRERKEARPTDVSSLLQRLPFSTRDKPCLSDCCTFFNVKRAAQKVAVHMYVRSQSYIIIFRSCCQEVIFPSVWPLRPSLWYILRSALPLSLVLSRCLRFVTFAWVFRSVHMISGHVAPTSLSLSFSVSVGLPVVSRGRDVES